MKKAISTVKRCLLTVAAAMLVSSAALANIDISGTVHDEFGDPLIGASVLLKGSQNGVSTDIDGKYILTNVPEQGVLQVSYVGFDTQDVKINGRSEVNVVMRQNNQMLDEVVVVGYGSLSRKELTSSIVQVDKDDFVKGGMNNAMEMITGKVAGLNVSTTAAANPNSSSSLQVRGATSLSTSNSPLIVIDGVAGGDIRTLAPQDIESMTVLKDAASAAIYGTRGANGVILITTKRNGGEAGKPTVTYDSYISLAIAKDKPQVLDAAEWRRARRGNDFGATTDWYEEITRDVAYDTNQYVSIDGVTDGGYYTASVNYKKANGLDIVSGREEFGGRAAVQQLFLNKHLQLSANISARKVHEDWGNDGLFDTALGFNPTMPVYNEDGTFFQPTSPTDVHNPVGDLLLNTHEGDRTYILGTTEAKWNIWNNEYHTVNASVQYSYQYNDLKDNFYTPTNSSESYWSDYNGRAYIRYQKWWTNSVEAIANYFFNKGDNDVKVMLGYTYERTNWEQMYERNNDFIFDNALWHGIGSGTYLSDGKADMYAGKSESTLVGFFGRVNYNWRSMIIASASLRYEGSSKFGADHKWGYFPAASLAWEIARAPFMSSYGHIVQSLKPRFSYGVTGRSDFSAYQSLATYTPNGTYLIDGTWVTGYAFANNPNPNLGWEKAISYNYGVDFMLFNRINGSIEYFDRRSQDLLYNYVAPQPPYVYDNILVNVGTTKNTGIEVALNADVFVNTPVSWTTGINYSYGTTKLTKLSSDVYRASYAEFYDKPGVGTSEKLFRVEEDGKVAQFYGYEYAGIDENGNMLVYDNDNQPVLASVADPNFKRYIGNGAPNHFLTWNNSLRWRDFDLSVQFSGAFGFKIFNVRKYGMGNSGSGSDNVLRSAYLEDKALKSSAGVFSSYFLEDGDYFKLQNLTLGYNVPFKNRKVINSLRVFVSAKNLFTITKYSGTDPAAVPSTDITPGVDSSSAYPTATQVALGVTLKFR